MRTRTTALSLVAFAVCLAIAALAGAAMVGIYRNPLATSSQRAQLVKLSGRNCSRRGSGQALRITIGKRTSECVYRTPVVGRDLEIGATERLLSGTPKPLQRKVFIGLTLRAGGGSRYQLLVYPLQQKVQLRKVLSDGTVKYLAISREVSAVQGLNAANTLSLSAINGPRAGEAQVRAFLGGKPVAEASDESTRALGGRASAVAIGAARSAPGALASVENVVVRVPSPF
jgi:hypothetical protein